MEAIGDTVEIFLIFAAFMLYLLLAPVFYLVRAIKYHEWNNFLLIPAIAWIAGAILGILL